MEIFVTSEDSDRFPSWQSYFERESLKGYSVANMQEGDRAYATFPVIASRRLGLLRKRKAVGYLGRSPFRELISHLTWQMVSATRRIAAGPVRPFSPLFYRLEILLVRSGFYENSSNRYRAYVSQGFPKGFLPLPPAEKRKWAKKE